jgi:hypothetical protein
MTRSSAKCTSKGTNSLIGMGYTSRFLWRNHLKSLQHLSKRLPIPVDSPFLKKYWLIFCSHLCWPQCVSEWCPPTVENNLQPPCCQFLRETSSLQEHQVQLQKHRHFRQKMGGNHRQDNQFQHKPRKWALHIPISGIHSIDPNRRQIIRSMWLLIILLYLSALSTLESMIRVCYYLRCC